MRCLVALAFPFLLAAAPAQAQAVYRCGSTYSHQPCHGGTAVDVRPPVSDPDAAAMADLFLCEGRRGHRFWSQEHCNRRDAVIERIERVPAGLPMHQQAEIANGQTDAGYRLQRRNLQPTPARTPAGAVRTRDAVCAALEQQVRSLDATARQPHSPVRQSAIARDRKSARDAQFRRGCG